ncbi:right-handed parallel beta-helix repeat-containing protein, partial [Escherichia coli]|uniref:right-handed parallel beta-helix repeat-containing protein n=1 Tax=Escherichia coli TaxID=562 RepID=UPI0032E497D8
FSIGRSTEAVTLDAVKAVANGRNGVSLDGRALADGPNAVGTAVNAYGNNTVAGGTFEDNARYGIEVIGGTSLAVSDNRVAGNDVGIVTADGAKGVSITGNILVDNARQAIAVRDGGATAEVTGNRISG